MIIGSDYLIIIVEGTRQVIKFIKHKISEFLVKLHPVENIAKIFKISKKSGYRSIGVSFQ